MRLENRMVRRLSLPLVLGLAIACGSKGTPESVDSGGTTRGGALGTGGAQADAVTGQGGTAAQGTPSELVDACIAFKMAQCQRATECGSPSGNCLSMTLECPDSLFSPGSSFTVSAAKECAKQFATLPCEAAVQERLPSCAPVGTRSEGQPCTSDTQCQSNQCIRGSQCGECAAVAKNGDPCASNPACPPGSLCASSGTCAPFPTGTAVPVKTVDAGADLPSLGMSCTASLACAGASYCDGETCQALPGKNDLCGIDAQTGSPRHCADGLFCEWKTTAFCRALPVAGEACAVGLDSTPAQVNWLCASGHFCSGTATAYPRCRSYEYASCTSTLLDCGESLVCACRTDSPIFCLSRACYELRLAGQPCDAEKKPCHPAFACDNGTCVARASQGIFRELCKQ